MLSLFEGVIATPFSIHIIETILKIRKHFTNVFAALIFLLPLNTVAWNYTGHVVIAQIAYDNLNANTKRKVDYLSRLIYAQLPNNEIAQLDKQYPGASEFSKLAILPDVWRNWRLVTIFAKFRDLILLGTNGGRTSSYTTLKSSENIPSRYELDRCKKLSYDEFKLSAEKFGFIIHFSSSEKKL